MFQDKLSDFRLARLVVRRYVSVSSQPLLACCCFITKHIGLVTLSFGDSRVFDAGTFGPVNIHPSAMLREVLHLASAKFTRSSVNA